VEKRKFLSLPELELGTLGRGVQTVVSRYTPTTLKSSDFNFGFYLCQDTITTPYIERRKISPSHLKKTEPEETKLYDGRHKQLYIFFSRSKIVETFVLRDGKKVK
jgi:hypothetical protein